MDKLTPRRRSENMSRIRSKDTKPELIARRLIFAMGYRYRLHAAGLPGKPDMVFPARKKVIFIHGCFWHRHPRRGCSDARPPKSNTGYWGPKLDRNFERDRANRKALAELGWRTLVVWECELKDPERVARRAREFLEG